MMYIIKDINNVVINSFDTLENAETFVSIMPDCTLEETEEDWQLIDGIYRLGGKTIEEQNEAIRQTRQQAYIETSDPLYMDYQESLARGEETAEEKKQLWLSAKDKIREENPYVVDNPENLDKTK